MLQIDSLTKTFRTHGRSLTAVQSVSLCVAPGEFVAITGPSGCGKSTLLLMAGALLHPTSGRVRLCEQDVYACSPGARTRLRAAHIGFVFQQFHLVPYLPVLENVLVPTLAVGNAGGTRERALELLERFGMADRLEHLPAELSVGECQRVALARALLNSPGLLLADEPTGNLDPENEERILTHVRDFTAAGGAVLLVTHSPGAAAGADRVMRMERGLILPA
jgi:ABC-type lipoprotein export system ATPase subunit